MPKEKIGSDVLGKRRRVKPYRLMPKELQKRLEKLAEERKRRLEELGIREDEKQKIRQLEMEGKLPIPGELPHEKKLGESKEFIEKPKRKRKTKKKVKITETYEL